MTEAALYPAANSDSLLESRPGLSEAGSRRTSLSFFFVMLFTVAIYARPEDIVPALGRFHLTFVLGLCAGFAYLGPFLLDNASFVWTKELQIVLLLTGCFVAGIPFAYWRGGSFQVLTQVWLKTLIIFFLLTQTLVTLERIRKILWAIIFSELVVCAYSVVQSSHVVWVDQRLSGVSLGILGWNFLGIAAALTNPYIAALYISQPGFLKTGLLVSAVLFLLWMLVLTASRSGVLNVLFSIALTWLVVLCGTFLGNFEIASGTELGRPEDWLGAHSTFAQISSEAGVPALMLFISLLWTAIRRMKTLSKTIADGPEGFDLKLMARATWGSLLSFVFGAFFAHIGYEYFLYYPVAIAVGLQYLRRATPAPSGSMPHSLIPELQASATDGSS